MRRRLETLLAGPDFAWYLNRPRPDRPPRREARDEYVEAVPVAVVPAPMREAAGATLRTLCLTEPVADKQWRRHGPGQERPRDRHTVPVAWWADIQAILDTVTPVRQDNGRWRYDDVVRGRRLIITRDELGRLIVVSYHPRRFRDPT